MQNSIELLNIAHWQTLYFIICFYLRPENQSFKVSACKNRQTKSYMLFYFNSNHCQNKPHSFLDSLYSRCQLVGYQSISCLDALWSHMIHESSHHGCQSLQVSETTQFVLSDGYHHLLTTPPGPARTYPEPMALAKWPNMASTTSKHIRIEENSERKHLLGVLIEEQQQELEKPQITVSNDRKVVQ